MENTTTIYEFQLDDIIEALRITSNIFSVQPEYKHLNVQVKEASKFAEDVIGDNSRMEVIEIKISELDAIIEILKITSNIYNCSNGVTCHDRQVRQSLKYAENAKVGKKEERVKYM